MTLRAIGLAGAVGMLAGCTALTEELPSPTATQDVVPAVNSPAPAPSVVHEPAELLPEEGETLVLYLSGKGGQRGGRISLGQGETYISWTCSGSGPISFSFLDEVGFSDACESFGPDETRRNSGMTLSGKDLDVMVEALPGQDWQLLVTQKSR